jgi:hypothetical protein
MALPTLDKVKSILASSRAIRERILAIARRLEALNEYHPEQALIVAADIVIHSLKHASTNIS